MSAENAVSASRRRPAGECSAGAESPGIDLRRLGRAALLGRPAAATGSRTPSNTSPRCTAPTIRDADLDILRRAYVLAESSHRGQMRKSGEPYITHPLAVTLILAELGAETTTLTASLLHDTVEDTDVTLDQVGEEFGEEVRYLVDGVTKLEKVDYGAAAEPETFRKMLVATGNDVRVMSIKLADRLHNMRTLGVMRPEKQARIAKVTRDVLIPLAERLGVQALKTELEDLVFAILHPEEYARTRELDRRAAPQAPDPLDRVADDVRAVLREAGHPRRGRASGRGTCVSVHRTRLKRGGDLGGSDFGRLLVLVGRGRRLLRRPGRTAHLLHPGDLRVQGLHRRAQVQPVPVAAHRGRRRATAQVAEVLVRTQQMHRVAEAGVIALGNPYAQPVDERLARRTGERADPTRPGWLSRLLEWQRDAPTPTPSGPRCATTSPRTARSPSSRADGGTLGLPAGATCVDAAYAQHGEGRARLRRRPGQRPPRVARHRPARRRHR